MSSLPSDRHAAELTLLSVVGRRGRHTSVMGPVMSSLPSDRHAAELTLLSVVGRRGRHTMLSEGTVKVGAGVDIGSAVLMHSRHGQ